MRRLLFDKTTPHRVICLTGPHGIGKSTLAYLFRRQLEYDEVNMAWHEVRHHQIPDGIEPLGVATFAMRRDARIELVQRLTDLEPSAPRTMHIVFLDDAHLVFGETSFWTALETAIESWLPTNVRFIVAATSFSSTSELPSMLNKYPRIDQDALKLLYAKAREYLLRNSDLANVYDEIPYGGKLKRRSLKKDSLVDVLIRASDGSVGLLDSLVEGLVEKDRVDSKQSERGLVRSFFSEKVSTNIAEALKLDDEATRCGLQSLRGLTFRYELPRSSVGRAFALAAQDTLIADTAAEPKVKELFDLGLVVWTTDRTTGTTGYRLAFPSPCAKRLAMACAFTHPDERQTLSEPTTPSSLVKSILRWIEPLESAATTTSNNGTIVTQFYEQFIEALSRRRNFESEVYPELLDVFPCTASEVSRANDTPPHATTIEIDVIYAVDDRTLWGLQVRMTDQDPQTLMAPVRRFAPGQRYGILRVDDAMVVDIVLVAADAELEPPVDEKQKCMVVYYDTTQGAFVASSTGGDKRRRKRRKRA